MNSNELQVPPKIELPGFGLDVEFEPYYREEEGKRQPFVNALEMDDGPYSGPLYRGSGIRTRSLPLLCLREIAMTQLMNTLTDKPNWHEKVFNEDIVQKWKQETLTRKEDDFTDNMFGWCIEELRFRSKSAAFKNTGAISVFTADVVKSDSAIPESVRSALNEAVHPLENIPECEKDWHPGSDGTVLDLVHPSLFPLVYGRSRILPHGRTNLDDFIERSCEGVTVPITSRYNGSYSGKFQWLPCDVDISSGNSKILSYINNLDPAKHQKLYKSIEEIITRTIPLWNITLTPQRSPEVFYTRLELRRIIYDGPEAVKPDVGSFMPPLIPGEPIPKQYDHDPTVFQRKHLSGAFEFSDAKTYYTTPPWHFPGFFKLPMDWNVDLQKDYGKQGLQVIVKLANIHLTPEKPEYGGGTWHIEGQMNEHIVATAIYYYDSENITENHLSFRQHSRVNDLMHGVFYPQNTTSWVSQLYGCDMHESRTSPQFIGAVETKQGRLLTFPNVLQHQVSPFKLEDPTKSGHRKILALFLVDPTIRIISTTNVPCQRKDWWASRLSDGSGRPLFSAFPQELRDMIMNQVDDFPIGLDEAKALRLELMEQRSAFVIEQGHQFKGAEISLCEH